MRTIIAGSRGFTNPDVLLNAINKCPFTKEITSVVCGMAKGIDTLGRQWAILQGFPVNEFPANWNKYGKSAGLLRNIEMAKNADALLAIPGSGPGTYHMIRTAKEYNLKIFVYKIGV